MDLVALLYVPYKIVTGVVEIRKPKDFKIENEYPHMTLMTGDWKPVHSNDLLQTVFDKKGPFEDLYDDGSKVNIWQKGSIIVEECRTKVLKKDKEKNDVYLCRLKKPLELYCRAEAFFRNKNKSKNKNKNKNKKR